MITKPKSIVLVTVDCLRGDHVGFLGYNRPTTPFLDALAAESLVFPAAIVAGAPTYYSFPSILASRYPLVMGRDVLGFGPDEPTLASVLKRAGYATGAFNAANPYISSRFGYDRGFDVFRDFQDAVKEPPREQKATPSGWMSRVNRKLQETSPRLGPLGDVYQELYFRYCEHVAAPTASFDELRRFPSADVVVDQAWKWLESVSNSPFFLWLHLMDPHSPYYPNQTSLALMGAGAIGPSRARYLNSYWNRAELGPRRLSRYRNEVVGLYDAGIRWVDRQMQKLIERLRSASLWEQCVFVLTADHGEEFLDHGGRYHPPTRLMEELIRVPLLLRVPGAMTGNVGGSPFSLLHLAPTLLEAVQLQSPPEFQGRSRWQGLQGLGAQDDCAITECVAGCTNPFRVENRMGPRVLSVRESRFKLVVNFHSVAECLYDLEADPQEQHPLPVASHKEARGRLLRTAREHLRRSYGERDCRERARARLRELRLEWTGPAEKVPAAAL